MKPLATSRRSAAASLRAELPAMAYASGNLGKVLLWSASELTLLFLLTEVFGIEPGIAATLLTLTLLADLLIDLLAGRIAAGASARARPYGVLVLMGAPVAALGFALLFALPAGGTTSPALLACALLLFRTGYGLVDVAHSAMLPSVSPDSRTRGRVAGYRSFFSAVATLLVASVIAPAAAAAGQTGEAGTIRWVGLGAALLFLLCMGIVVRSDRSGRGTASDAAGTVPQPLLPVLQGQLVRLLAVGLVAGTAIPMLGRCFLYLAHYVFEAPRLAGALLTAAVLGQFAGIPMWTVLAHRFEKRTALAGAGIATAFTVAGFAAAPPQFQLLASALVGAAVVGVLMIPWGLLADIVDMDARRDGERREPQSFAAYLVALKGGGGLGTLALGWALSLAGHGSSEADVAAVASTVQWLAYGLPIAGGLATGALAIGLAVTHAGHATVEGRKG